ncbi:hypothetical protein U0070_021218 [Myodes glareolus]|uniref:Uncharacterized protein n=1 Tax=Myodes glareolus TaxID=447135 RepID=A0AAW0H442_MYOGA
MTPKMPFLHSCPLPGPAAATSCYTFTEYFTTWVKQRTAQSLEWIGLIDPEDDETKYAQKFQGQNTLSEGTSSSTHYIEFSSSRLCSQLLCETQHCSHILRLSEVQE